MKKLLLLFSFICCILVFGQDKVTRNYRYGENSKDAKVRFKKFQDEVLSRKFNIEYRDDLSSDDIAVYYRSEDEPGKTKIIATYKFNGTDFTIHLIDITCTLKSTGVNRPVRSGDLEPSFRKYYEDIRNIFVTQQANYIAPGANK